jgi:Fic family protein
MFVTMAKDTRRDKAWNHALEAALDGEEIRRFSIASEAKVSERTAGDVLRTMAEYGWLERVGGKGPQRAYFVAGERLPKNLTSYKSEGER